MCEVVGWGRGGEREGGRELIGSQIQEEKYGWGRERMGRRTNINIHIHHTLLHVSDNTL